MNNLADENKLSEESSEHDIHKKKQKQNGRRLIIIAFVALIFMVATYAWFIGTSSVGVSAFKVNIASSDGLAISLDGINFTDSIQVDKTKITTGLIPTYPNHKNHWVNMEENPSNPGLVPVSSSGVMDLEHSVLQLYSKSSITSLTGGYRLVSDRIINYATEDDFEDPEDFEAGIMERDGYVAFDVFIKNSSGNNYYQSFNSANDEAVYMQTTSSVILSAYDTETAGKSSDGGEGLQNSARVAFMQIGRTDMAHISADDNAQRLSCNSDEDEDHNPDDVSLCNRSDENMSRSDGRGYTWNIWEPNDKDHTDESVAHFKRICQKRTVTSGGNSTYSGVCTPVINPISGIRDVDMDDHLYVETYPVLNPVISNANVNIYDGLNGYDGTIGDDYYLKNMDYFTDTIKNKVYANPDDENRREPFMYLAPNSVTKIRVYIWLEGQDVDNFDITSTNIGLTVNFGFTKDQFDQVETSIKYNISLAAIGSGTINDTNVFTDGALTSGSGVISENPAGTDVTLSAVPASGSIFAAWSDGNTDNPRSISAYKDETYTAIFIGEDETYVHVKPNNDDWGTVTGGGTYDSTPLDLVATANTGYVFEKWSFIDEEEGSVDPNYSYEPSNSGYIVVTAIFKPVDLNMDIIHYTGQSNSTCSVSITKDNVAFGNPVSLKVVAASGWRFKGWKYGQTKSGLNLSTASGELTAAELFEYPSEIVQTTANPLNIPVVRSDLLFVPECVQLFTITAGVSTDSPEGSGSVSITSKVVESGDSLTITATPTSGHQIIKWTVDGVENVPENNTQLVLENIDANHNVLVKFAVNPSVEPEP